MNIESNEVPVIPEILKCPICIGPCLYIKAIVDPFLTLNNPPHLKYFPVISYLT